MMGQALKVQTPTYWKAFTDKLKKLYITQWKGFRQDEMCAATLVLEGSEKVLILINFCGQVLPSSEIFRKFVFFF